MSARLKLNVFFFRFLLLLYSWERVLDTDWLLSIVDSRDVIPSFSRQLSKQVTLISYVVRWGRWCRCPVAGEAHRPLRAIPDTYIIYLTALHHLFKIHDDDVPQKNGRHVLVRRKGVRLMERCRNSKRHEHSRTGSSIRREGVNNQSTPSTTERERWQSQNKNSRTE